MAKLPFSTPPGASPDGEPVGSTAPDLSRNIEECTLSWNLVREGHLLLAIS